jgi:hypothetical protein
MYEHLHFLTESTALFGFDIQIWMMIAIACAAVVLLVVLPDIIGK